MLPPNQLYKHNSLWHKQTKPTVPVAWCNNAGLLLNSKSQVKLLFPFLRSGLKCMVPTGNRLSLLYFCYQYNFFDHYFLFWGGNEVFSGCMWATARGLYIHVIEDSIFPQCLQIPCWVIYNLYILKFHLCFIWKKTKCKWIKTFVS